MYDYNDVVRIEVPKEYREWGCNPADDGIIGKIVDFGEIKMNENDAKECGLPGPGVYRNRYWVYLEIDGVRHPYLFPTHFIKPVNGYPSRWFDMKNDYVRPLDAP